MREARGVVGSELIVFVAVGAWSALKLLVNGPVLLVKLLLVRIRQARARRALLAYGYAPGTPVGPVVARV